MEEGKMAKINCNIVVTVSDKILSMAMLTGKGQKDRWICVRYRVVWSYACDIDEAISSEAMLMVSCQADEMI